MSTIKPKNEMPIVIPLEDREDDINFLKKSFQKIKEGRGDDMVAPATQSKSKRNYTVTQKVIDSRNRLKNDRKDRMKRLNERNNAKMKELEDIKKKKTVERDEVNRIINENLDKRFIPLIDKFNDLQKIITPKSESSRPDNLLNTEGLSTIDEMSSTEDNTHHSVIHKSVKFDGYRSDPGTDDWRKKQINTRFSKPALATTWRKY